MILLNYIFIYICSKRSIILIDYMVIIMRIEHGESCISFIPLFVIYNVVKHIHQTHVIYTYYNYAITLVVNFSEFQEIIMNFDAFMLNRISLANR